jgi:hypothetical protein
VSTSESVNVQLEVRHTADTVSGRLAVEGAAASDFYGWLELINVLERAVNSDGAQPERLQAAESVQHPSKEVLP